MAVNGDRFWSTACRGDVAAILEGLRVEVLEYFLRKLGAPRRVDTPEERMLIWLLGQALSC